jgi:TfoX/Sxy family transcriptional regulator of competence genes
MAYSQNIDDMIYPIAEDLKLNRKKMFGGTCYLLNNKMGCCVWKDKIIVRIGEEQAKNVLNKGEGEIPNITGRPMKGWIMISEDRLSASSIKAWINQAILFVETIEDESCSINILKKKS